MQAWDVRKGAVHMTLSGHTDTITGLSMSPDGLHLLSNAMDNTVRAWDVRPFCAGSRCARVFKGATHGFEKMLIRCAWDSTGRRVGAGSGDHCVYVWDFETGQLQYKLPGHTGCVNEVRTLRVARRMLSRPALTVAPTPPQVSFSPTEPVIASCSTDHNIYLGEISAQ